MCGRFTLTLDPDELQQAFPQFTFPAGFRPRYNIAPTQPALAVPNDGTGRAGFFTWGLVPSWAKDPSIASRLINARAETLAEKPSFRSAFKYRRCLVLADGFFEWQAQAGQKGKVPHHISLLSGLPFAMAGLWENWNSPDGSAIRSCTIVTTQPNALTAGIHNRMPVILPPEAFKAWLDPAPRLAEGLLPLLAPYPAGAMTARPVSTLVNSPANDRPEILLPA
ncbi:MAG: SOS response-associated peptidase [Chloroflexi bacterium]|nr:SOS response-associated peptidase [Chloroflexota bacterium]